MVRMAKLRKSVFALLGAVLVCLVVISKATNTGPGNSSRLLNPKSSDEAKEASSILPAWRGIAEDDVDLVISHILTKDLSFFLNLSEEEGAVAARLLQITRVVQHLVQGDDAEFIGGIVSWLASQGFPDTTIICWHALKQQSLAALWPVRASVQAVSSWGKTALSEAIRAGNWSVVNFLLDAGIHPSKEILRYLMDKIRFQEKLEDIALESSSKLLRMSEIDSWCDTTALHLAARSNKTELVQRLLSANRDPLAVDDGDILPLDEALFSGNIDIVWAILQAMMDKTPGGRVSDLDKYYQAVLRSIVYARDAIALEEFVLKRGRNALPDVLQDPYRMVGLAVLTHRPLMLAYFRPQLEHSRSPLRDYDDASVLGYAAAAGDSDLLASLLHHTPSDSSPVVVVSVDAVVQAVAKSDMDSLDLLLHFISSRTSSPNVMEYASALDLCVFKGNVKALGLFHNLGFDLTIAEDFFSLVHFAAAQNQVEILQFLLGLPGVDINLRDPDNRTPLMYSAATNPPGEEAMQFLLASGADPTLEDHEHNTALSLSAAYISRETAKALLDHGASLKTGTSGSIGSKIWVTLPLARALTGSEDIVRLLLAAGAMEERIRAGNLAFFIRAVIQCYVGDVCARDNMVEILYDHMHPHLPLDEVSDIFLWPALEAQRTTVIRMLLEKGVDPNVRRNHVLPVNFAAKRGYGVSVDLLVRHGATTQGTGPDCESALTSALRANQTKVALRLLIDHRVEPNEAELRLIDDRGIPIGLVEAELKMTRKKRVENDYDKS